ncbi:MAG: DUF2577 domain-containing protein [Bacillota bacterium]
MSNASDLVKLLQIASTEAVEMTQPTAILFGTVTSTEPLEITVEQRLILSMAQLLLSRNVTDHIVKVSMEWDSEPAGETEHTHAVDTRVETAGDPSHTHGVTSAVANSNLEHTHAVRGEKEMTVHNALQLEEKVLLLRMQGGQKFLVMDRVVEE